MRGTHLKKHENGYYYVHWTEGRRGRHESTRVKELPAAERYLAQNIALRQKGAGGAGPALKVAELWALYDRKHIETETAAPAGIRFAWKNLDRHFGPLMLAAIDQDVVDAYTAKRLSGAIGRPSKPVTVRKELSHLQACFNWCADPTRKYAPRDAIPAFKLPPNSAPRDRWLKHPEIQKLLDAAREMHPGPLLSRGELFLWLALETAARKTAILTLTWDRVDFETNVVHYRDPDRPETKKRRADVPISPALRPILLRAYAERRNDLVMTSTVDVWATVQCIADRAGFGERAARNKLAVLLGDKPESRKTGEKPSRTGISPHVLRHTAATHMARRGVSLWKIAKVLGNTLGMVERVYAKHCPDDLREAVGLISGKELV